MNWFENWFNTKYYHILYGNRNHEEAKLFINNLTSHLNLKKNSKIIDIACGTGRHAIYLNMLGYNVTGIDLSKNNIEEASKFSKKNLRFYIHDMRKLFKPNQYDLAVNLFTSFGYFNKDSDNEKALISIAGNVKREGLIVIDFMNVKKVLMNLIEAEIKIINNVQFKINRTVKNDKIFKSINITDEKEKFVFKEEVSIITLDKFSDYIKKAGLQIIDIFGNYHLESFNALKSDRLILVCKK
jgi:2-polyprenyl-3-methyl-5-hydroxy-6-metoxy-1,4-benzoquinol methylase